MEGVEYRKKGLPAGRNGGIHANKNLEGIIKYDEISLSPPYYLFLSFPVQFPVLFSYDTTCSFFLDNFRSLFYSHKNVFTFLLFAFSIMQRGGGKSEGKIPLARPRSRWENTIKLNIKNTILEGGLDSSGSG
jgi:hypothetical protein